MNKIGFKRIKYYKEKNNFEDLVTTDEKRGISDIKIENIIKDIIDGKLIESVNDYSKHHYQLA